MKPISSRLQYFFKPRSWVLLLNDDEAGLCELQPLETACKHWGGELAFPPKWDELQSKSEWGNEDFWKSAFPGIALLHARKQDIILSELLNGFNVHKASKLLCRKLNLNEGLFGYLLFFDENRKTFARELTPNETPKDWARYVRESFLDHAFEIPSEVEIDDEVQSWLIQKERTASIPFGVAQLIREGLQQRNGVLADTRNTQLLSEAQAEYPQLHLNLYELSLEFREIDLKVKLAPLDFSVYYLYINHPEGFSNKNRRIHRNKLLGYYRRFKSTDNRERSDALIDALFNPYDDKSFRDAIYRINKKIGQVFDDPSYSYVFRITGERGAERKVLYPRERLTES